MKAVPLYGKRALFVPSLKAIVIADLHIGIEYELSLNGANIPSQTRILLQRCLELGKEKNVKSVKRYVNSKLGSINDTKDPIRKEYRKLLPGFKR